MKIDQILKRFLFVLLLAGFIRADQPQQILNKVSKVYVNIIPFNLRFSVQSWDKNDNLLSAVEGDFLINSQKGFRVNYPQEEILYDGQWLWTHNKATNQLIVEEFDPTSSLTLIYDVINGNINNYEIMKYDQQNKYRNIFLKPEGENNFFKQIKLVVPQDTILIDHLEYIDFQDNQILINFLRIQDTTITDSSFYELKDLKDKELIDLRP
ncbi:MAG: outer membrane lipoprotein carrier protein LolA [Candidatus Marinimicrobia bacterium]|nr:outer membrane lipoprotein carrier protein LolA [Candidatus Neomarinimicrobiota bacterium]